MGDKIDVLAAVDRAARELWVTGQPVNPIALDLISARAAIAELIEADKEYDAAEQECVDHHRPLFKRGKEWSERQSQIEARCDAAIARRAAAIARVSGGQA